MNELELRQRKARRTALLVGLVALGIYSMFWIGGVFNA